MKYRTKPVAIEATVWQKLGDHPVVSQFIAEGKASRCVQCHRLATEHGTCPTLEGNSIVCPGDYIITGLKGEHYPCKPDIFHMKYEEADGE